MKKFLGCFEKETIVSHPLPEVSNDKDPVLGWHHKEVALGHFTARPRLFENNFHQLIGIEYQLYVAEADWGGCSSIGLKLQSSCRVMIF